MVLTRKDAKSRSSKIEPTTTNKKRGVSQITKSEQSLNQL